jgi:hypothetical protein
VREGVVAVTVSEKQKSSGKRVPRDVSKYVQQSLVKSLEEVLLGFTKKAKTGNSSAHVRLYFELLDRPKMKKRGLAEALLADLEKRRAKKNRAEAAGS